MKTKEVSAKLAQYRPKHLTIEDIKSGCVTLFGENEEEIKLCVIQEEFRQGLDLLMDLTPSVTFYGSSRVGQDSKEYKQVEHLAYRIAKELGYAVISGGGGGLMEAANKGAHDAGGKSVGLTIRLPNEQRTNEYVTDEIPFYFFFTRQVSMSYTTEVCIFAPGGFGTLYEFFEMMTLQQTHKIGRIPIILLGTDYWRPLDKMIEELLNNGYHTVNAEDRKLYTITDNEDEILKIIEESKLRDGRDALA
jgi:uncharacterized protein (TIGR00730 family)